MGKEEEDGRDSCCSSQDKQDRERAFHQLPFLLFRPPPHFRNAFFFLSLHTYTYAQGEHCGTSNCLLPSSYGGGGGDATKPTSQEGFGGRIFVLLLFFFFFTRLFLLLLLHMSFSSSFCFGRVARSLQLVEGDQILSVFFFSIWTGFSELEIRGDVS